MVRAIVVDDDADLRLLARFMLEDAGLIEVVGEAPNAREALALISSVLPDVAIVDIHMPGMSGIELIQTLRHAAIRTRLIAYSSDDLALADAVRAGADAAVLKTGRSEDLLAAIAA